MNNQIEVPDSSDWTTTCIPLFAALDASLRCQICKDFYDAAVITNCAHTFCSSCIRRAISADGKCPACRSNVQEHSLRRNVAVQEVVDKFQTARPQALEVARAQQSSEDIEDVHVRRSSKRKRTNVDEHASGQGVRTRSQRKRSKPNTDGAADAVFIDDTDDAQEDDYAPGASQEDPEPQDGLVPCPICNTRMKEAAVFTHLDQCDGKPVRAPSRKATPLQHIPTAITTSRPAPPPPERLPQLNYSLMKEKDLKTKLQQLGIPASGSKELMSRRHKEWINLVNSNSDSLRPKTKRDLLAELDTWERTQGGYAVGNRGFSASGDVMRKDFDGRGWMQSHQSDFDRLIADARKGRLKALEKKDEEGEGKRDGAEVVDAKPDGADPSGAEPVDAEPIPQDQEHVPVETNGLPGPPPETPAQQIPTAAEDIALPDNSLPSQHYAQAPQDIADVGGELKKLPMFAVPREPALDMHLDTK